MREHETLQHVALEKEQQPIAPVIVSQHVVPVGQVYPPPQSITRMFSEALETARNRKNANIAKERKERKKKINKKLLFELKTHPVVY